MVKAFLAPRSFQIKANGMIGEATMTVGTPQGSSLSPSIFTIYMSEMVRGAQELDREHQASKMRNTRNVRSRSSAKHLESSFQSLQFIDDSNSVVHGDVKDMDRALTQAADEFELTWDQAKDWKNGVHLGST